MKFNNFLSILIFTSFISIVGFFIFSNSSEDKMLKANIEAFADNPPVTWVDDNNKESFTNDKECVIVEEGPNGVLILTPGTLFECKAGETYCKKACMEE